MTLTNAGKPSPGRAHLAALLASGAFAALLPGAALAGEEPQDAASAAAPSTEIADIIVTANRSGAQSLQNVPIAVAVVNIQQVTRSSQGNLVDLAKFTPSLSITEGAPGYNKFNMRGLSTGGYASSDISDRTLVAVYLDDTPISVQGQTPDLKVYDLERVEVLRGPQGTLYGAGSMAGTVRFVTAKPDASDAFGSMELGAATTQHGEGSYNVRGMFNMPLVADTLALRANFFVGREGGYIDNIGRQDKENANRNTTYQGRVALRWTPNDKMIFDASFTYAESKAGGLNSAFDGLEPFTILTNGPQGTDDKFRLFQLGADFDLGFASLILSGSYTNRDVGFDASPDPTIAYFFVDYGSGLPVGQGSYPLFTAPTSWSKDISLLLPAELYQIDQNIKDYMFEGRLVSKDDGPVSWTAGVFYEKQKRRLVQDIPTPGFDTLSYMNFFYGPFPQTPDGKYSSVLVDQAFSPESIYSGLQNQDEHQLALYADGTWHVTDRLDLTAGIRYFDFKLDYSLFSSGVYGVVNNTPLTLDATLRSSGVNPRGNVSYKVNDDFLVYGEVARGFRYGGGNQPVPLGTSGIAGQCTQNLADYGYDAAPLTFGPDKLWNYTIGQKAKLAGGRVTLNTNAYLIKWSDVQTRLALDCSYFFTDNKGKITSKGIEVESMVKVTPSLMLQVSGSYNDSRADGDIPTVGAFDGDRTPYYPQWTGAAQLFYDTDLGTGVLHMHLGYQYQSSQNTRFNDKSTTLVNGELTVRGPSATWAVIPATHNVSASAAYEFGNIELGIYGNNLFNGVEKTNISRATYYALYQPGSSVTLTRPRTIGVRARMRF